MALFILGLLLPSLISTSKVLFCCSVTDYQLKEMINYAHDLNSTLNDIYLAQESNLTLKHSYKILNFTIKESPS
ncbi:hypothetical protein FGO68_gene12156 [Halteria grandinella]|uniref:Uncharacterized protein n=1 Tax=Halteria grandinella TaxID=5974 RepID=A0A8J8NZV9_HALGN|nr:hypothetical protein FGO68_gene12156 [Halteria grandinella]